MSFLRNACEAPHLSVVVPGRLEPARSQQQGCAHSGGDPAEQAQEDDLGMDQYLYIPFLVGWTSIYQLFWCSPGVQGFDHTAI